MLSWNRVASCKEIIAKQHIKIQGHADIHQIVAESRATLVQRDLDALCPKSGSCKNSTIILKHRSVTGLRFPSGFCPMNPSGEGGTIAAAKGYAEVKHRKGQCMSNHRSLHP